MIILDPDLEPDPATKMDSRKQNPARASESKAPIKKKNEIDLPTARTLSRYLKTAQEAVGLMGEVTVLLTTDEAIRGLNRRFRGKNKATDVLSFPAFSPGFGPAAERVAGDLAISVTTALRQANEQGHPLWMEIKVLILHGLLHLAGFDHEVDDGKMARRELKLRAKLKLPQGLIERAGGVPQGLKPRVRLGAGSARLKSCPDTKPRTHDILRQPLKSGPDTKPRTKGILRQPLKSCPDTKPRTHDILRQPLKSGPDTKPRTNGILRQPLKSGLDKKQLPRRFPSAGVDARTTAGLETGATVHLPKPKALKA
jgi:probable rRNA maturation factor